MKLLCSLAAVCGSSVVALAGTAQDYTVETRWVAVTTAAAQHPRGTQLPNGTVVDTNLNQATVGNDYAQLFELQARIINVTGQANLGVLALRGDIRVNGNGVNDAVLVNKNVAGLPGLGDRTPYNFGPDTEQYINYSNLGPAAPRVDSIEKFSADHSPWVDDQWTYNFETGQPNPFPNNPGALAGAGNTWASCYRVLVDIRPEDLSENTGSLVLSFTHGNEGARGMQGWYELPLFPDIVPPDEFNPTTNFQWRALQMYGAHPGALTGRGIEIPASFQLNIIPSPSAAALLGLGGLVAARRRRN